MGFELIVATHSDPATHFREGHTPSSPSYWTSMKVNGLFDFDASEALFSRLADVIDNGSDSVLIELDALGEYECLCDFAERIMHLRGDGYPLQVVTRNETSQRVLESIPGSRDWLLTFSQHDRETPRLALHLDQANQGDKNVG